MSRVSSNRASTILIGMAFVLLSSSASVAGEGEQKVRSEDGTLIGFECAGSGPELLIVPGGSGVRTRWLPMFAYLTKDFTVCAMDRRAYGGSADTLPYSLEKEVKDVGALVQSRGRPVAVLGHSFGGLIAYEAARRTPAISQLILYEAPIAYGDHGVVLDKVEALLAAGDRDGAARSFLTGFNGVSNAELENMQAQPSWPNLVAGLDLSVRQMRALNSYRWNATLAKQMRTPTLLLSGSRTTNAENLAGMKTLADTLPDRDVVLLEGQEHLAMVYDPAQLAEVIKRFLLKPR